MTAERGIRPSFYIPEYKLSWRMLSWLDGFSEGGFSRVFGRVRFVGKKSFMYQRITFRGIIVPLSRVYTAGGI